MPILTLNPTYFVSVRNDSATKFTAFASAGPADNDPPLRRFRCAMRFSLADLPVGATINSVGFNVTVALAQDATETWAFGAYGGAGSGDPETDAAADVHTACDVSADYYVNNAAWGTTGTKSHPNLGSQANADVAARAGSSFAIGIRQVGEDTAFTYSDFNITDSLAQLVIDYSTGADTSLDGDAAGDVGAAGALYIPRDGARTIESYGAAIDGFWDAALAAAIYDMTAPDAQTSVLLFKSAVYRFANQFPVPVRTLNGDGVSYSARPILLLGTQNAYTNRGLETTPTRGTVLDFQYSNASSAKLASTTCQLFAMANLTLTASAGFSTPFWRSTNAVPQMHNVCFFGQSGAGETAAQDALIFGGANQVEPSDSLDGGFQGYGGFVKNCFFRRIRRCVHGRAFFNSFVVKENTIWNDCGAADDTAAIDVDCGAFGGSQANTGNFVTDNLIEVTNYAYGVRLANAQQNRCDNSFYDPSQHKSKAAYKLESSAKNNYVAAANLPSKTGGGQLPLCDDDSWFAASGHTPTYIGSTSFSVPGDQLSVYRIGRLLRIMQSGVSASPIVFAKVATAVYSTVTTVTLTGVQGAAGIDGSIQSIDVQGAYPSQTNWQSASAQGVRCVTPPSIFPDENYATEIARLDVSYSVGSDALSVKPRATAALGSGVYLAGIYKAQIDGGAALFSFRYDGQLWFGDRNTTINGTFNGITWQAQGAGQLMRINSGSGGSYVAMRAYGLQFEYYSGGATKGQLKWSDGYLDSTVPLSPGAYTVAALPSGNPAAFKAGTAAFATNGRKSGEGVGAGTGCPVWWDGAAWRTFYDNSVVVA